MGNWRTVTIVGTCPPDELEALREHVRERDDYSNWTCLTATQGLCGLGDWPRERMDASGNLSERDYGVDDVAEALRGVVAVAPGIDLKIHCGDEREADNCIATVTASNGEVTIGPPEIEHIRGASPDETSGRLLAAMLRPKA